MNRDEMGIRLKKLRGERTQEEVALANDISISALAMYESGKRVPRDEVKIRLANYYKVSINSLFFGQNSHK